MIFSLGNLYCAVTLIIFLFVTYRLDLFVEPFKYWWRHVTKIFKIKWGNIFEYTYTLLSFSVFLFDVCVLSIIFAGMIRVRMMSSSPQLSTKRIDTLHWNRTNFLHSPPTWLNSQVLDQLVLWYSLTTIPVNAQEL